MDSFKKGDVVQLKSGGQPMTVNGVSIIGHVICKWFNDKEELCTRRLLPAMLKIYDEDEDAPAVGMMG